MPELLLVPVMTVKGRKCPDLLWIGFTGRYDAFIIMLDGSPFAVPVSRSGSNNILFFTLFNWSQSTTSIVPSLGKIHALNFLRL